MTNLDKYMYNNHVTKNTGIRGLGKMHENLKFPLSAMIADYDMILNQGCSPSHNIKETYALLNVLQKRNGFFPASFHDIDYFHGIFLILWIICDWVIQQWGFKIQNTF